MLLEINISNIALMESLRIELGSGFDVLTGETGAGKSIVVDALSLVLGGRADRDLIRTGAEKARVDALFDIQNNQAAQALIESYGLASEDGLLVVSRELTTAGRNVCRIAGSVVPLVQLKKLTGLLVDLHGQHEHQQLADANEHLHFLDAYGDQQHIECMRLVRAQYELYQSLSREAQSLNMDASERERRRDMLEFQLSEIDAVKPKLGEEETLKKKNELNRNAEKIAQGVEVAYDWMYRGAKRSESAQASIQRAAEAMEPIAELDERFSSLHQRLNELFYQAQDIGCELQDLNESLSFDPAQADKIAARLSELKKLTRKYGPEISDVIAFRDEAKHKLQEIDGGDERLSEILKQQKAEREKLDMQCAQLTQSRKQLAKQLSEKLIIELSDLGMARVRFEVRFRALPAGTYTASGVDSVEFMLSANPGEPLKPLSSVASGGELSRIMLALKTVAADSAGVFSMVFDEIDTGVSGRMAQVVGEKMAAIARHHQVICVTHLPQIAALGDHQYLVEKTIGEDRTGSDVRLLDTQGRIQELARLIGGAENSQSAQDHAKHLLEAGEAVKGSALNNPA